MSETQTEYDNANGLVYDLPFAEYQQREGLNASLIVHGRTSMLHMQAAMHEPCAPSAAMALGTAAHYVLLEGGGLVACDARRGSKEWLSAIETAGNESLVLKRDVYDAVHRMRDVAMTNKDIEYIINNSTREVSMFWRGKYGLAKGRIDILGNSFFADYKTTADATPEAFFRVSERMGYHIKMGYYAEGLEAKAHKAADVSVIIVQESKPPYDCGVIEIPPAIIRTGREQAVDIATRWQIAQKTGVYQGLYANGRIQYERPRYATFGEETDVSTGIADISEL